MTFISRFFDFRIIRKVLNLRASIRVVGLFRGVSPTVLVHRIAVHLLIFDVPTLTAILMSLSL